MSTYPNLITDANVEVALGDIKPHPLNWRTHGESQMATARNSLARGTAGNLIVNRRTGHILNGHMRYDLARRDGHDTITVDYVDVDEEEERRLLLTIDTVPLLADVDPEPLRELSADIDLDDLGLEVVIDGMLGALPELEPRSGGKNERLYADGRPEVEAGGAIECVHEYHCIHCDAPLEGTND